MLSSFVKLIADARAKQPATFLFGVIGILTTCIGALAAGITWALGLGAIAVVIFAATVLIVLALIVFGLPGLFSEWRWLNRCQCGFMTLTSPINNSVIPPGRSKLEGKHYGAIHSGAYWAIAVNGQDYWLHNPIRLQPDGTWVLPIDVGSNPGPRGTSILIVWVSGMVNCLLMAVKDRNKRLEPYVESEGHRIALNLPRDRRNLIVLDSAVLTIQ
jgi:hypothetical protein